MARASFRLRNTSIDAGSYLQYPIDDPAYATRTDNDNYLRADTLQLAPAVPTFDASEFFLEAVCTDYNVVELQWNVVLSSVLGAIPTPYELIIKYGSNGSPKSVNKGITLLSTTTAGTFTHTLENPPLWAYYSMFLRYGSTGGDDYYEPIANVKVLIPRDYKSTDDLYSRIPEYYRLLDEDNELEDGKKYLYTFLSIFGWDLDRCRSLLDYLITMRDPQIADRETLDTLSIDLGVGFDSQELGAGRVRNILDNIGYLRRSKGTQSAVQQHLRNITECDVEYDPTTSPVPEIRVFAQRANLIVDPRVAGGIVGSLDGGSPTTVYATGFELDSGVVGDPQLDGDYDGGATPTPSYAGIGTSSTLLAGQWISYPDLTNVGTLIFETTSASVRAIGGDVLYFSCHSAAESIIENVYLYTSGGYSSGTSTMVTESSAVVVSGTTRYWRLEIPEDYTTYTDMVLVIRCTDSSTTTVSDLDFLLLERSVVSEYFDGGSTSGAWIVDSVGAVSDYGWAGTPNASISVYTDNFQRVKYAVNRLLPTILPVNQLVTSSGTAYSNRVPTQYLNYDITWNNVPGI